MLKHPDVPGAVRRSAVRVDDAVNPIMQLHPLTAMVVSPPSLMIQSSPIACSTPAASEIHVDPELGCVARRKNRNPRFRAHTPLRPDDDPAAARKIHTRVIAHYGTVHRDRLLSVVFSIEPSCAPYFV